MKKDAISLDFQNLCLTHEYFKRNANTIVPAYTLLKHVAESQYQKKHNFIEHKDDPCYVPLSCYFLNDHFKPYTNGAYWEALLALRDLGFMDFADKGYSYTKGNPGKGECREYGVTDKAYQYVNQCNAQFLSKLFENKIIRKKNKRNVRMKRNRRQTYHEYSIEYTQDLLDNLNFDKSEMDILVAKYNRPKDVAVQSHITNKLIAVETKDYFRIARSEADRRIVNDFTMTKTDVRRKLRYKNLFQCLVVDIRAAHPTFFSSLISSAAYTLPLGKEIKAVEAEHEKWVKLFTDPFNDPRDVIGKQIGYKRQQVKSGLIMMINGETKWYPELITWLEREFPLLMRTYSKLPLEEKKTLGCHISGRFETNLIDDPELYRMSEAMDLKLGYENDGFTVFADKKNANVYKQVSMLKDWLVATSIKRFGVPIVVTVEPVQED